MGLKIFDFECYQCGHVHEEVVDNEDFLLCPKCGGTSRKIFTLGHGGLRTDTNFSWLPSACMTLLRPGETPILTRGAYKNYLKQNGIVESGGDSKIDGKYSML